VYGAVDGLWVSCVGYLSECEEVLVRGDICTHSTVDKSFLANLEL